jgi:SAM-dependent methyltransferase
MHEPRPPKLESYRSAEVARDYDQRWAGAAGQRRDLRKARALGRALDALAARCGEQPASILDIPCGTGRFAALLGARGLRYTGADLSPAMLDRARAKTPAARWLVADAARLPFDDGEFDVALCIRFLHLVRDPALRVAFLRELRRVARLGVVVGYHHSRTVRVAGRRLRHRLGLRERAPSNPSPGRIRAELREAGLPEAEWITVHFAPLLSDKVVLAAPVAAGTASPAS